ncbi:unnamed protein product [Cuscuta europaea]|uniref:Uncharacterized protein n=1 Tax=Cuscuta europaea TaxID=41803 RepID=A0A9P0ZG10_CUSEU|nr:unnamed protein product [Cuscuta europaea]
MADIMDDLMVDGEVTGNNGGVEDTYLRRTTVDENGRNAKTLNMENGGAVNEEDEVATENGNGGVVSDEDGGLNNARDEGFGGTGGRPVTQGVNEVPTFDGRDDYSFEGEGNRRGKTTTYVGGIFFDIHRQLTYSVSVCTDN